MAALLDSVSYLLSETSPERLGPCTAEIAFVGRSNVGKSSLLNALCKKDIARVSKTPGRTRAINVFVAGRPDRWLVDLPGYGYAEGPAEEREGWGPMIEGYLTGRPSLKMIFLLIDSKVGPTKLDLSMRDWLYSSRLPWRAVATKSDQVKPSKMVVRRRALAQALSVSPESVAWVSSAKQLGIKELRAEATGFLERVD